MLGRREFAAVFGDSLGDADADAILAARRRHHLPPEGVGRSDGTPDGTRRRTGLYKRAMSD